MLYAQIIALESIVVFGFEAAAPDVLFNNIISLLVVSRE